MLYFRKDVCLCLLITLLPFFPSLYPPVASPSPRLLSNERVSQYLDGVENLQSGEVTDLHATTFAVGKDDLGIETINGFCQISPDFLRELIFLFFETEHSSHPAAICLDIVNRKTRNEPKDFEGGQTDPQGPQVAGGKIGCFQRKFSEICIEAV